MGLQRVGAKPPETLGRFNLVRELAGRPDAWAAHRSDGALVVVHRVPTAGRASVLLPQARCLLGVDHPCVVRVRTVEMAGPDVLIETDYVDGELYSALLEASREQGEWVPLPVTLRIACDMLGALAVMHGATVGNRAVRVVHGRLAPLDILVGADGVARIILGARMSGGSDARTMGYLAPEILLAGDESADERTDVYVVGVLLWEALARRRLYEAANADALLAKQLHGVPPPPALAGAPWAAGIGAVALRALSTDPKDRFVSAPAMLEALLEAAGRRIGTADEVSTFVEGLVGPFIRARRREAITSLKPSNSDIRATQPDQDEATLARVAEEGEVPTKVHQQEALKELLLSSGDSEQLRTDVDLQFPPPGAALKRPTYDDDPSVTSPLPDALKQNLIANERALGDDPPTVSRSFPVASMAVEIGDPMRPPLESMATLERLPTDAYFDTGSVTTKRPAGSGAKFPDHHDREEDLSETATMERAEVIEQTAHMPKPASLGPILAMHPPQQPRPMPFEMRVPFPPPPPLPGHAPNLSVIIERPPPSALLGISTFFLVVASLTVLAWLTFPYWRGWAGL